MPSVCDSTQIPKPKGSIWYLKWLLWLLGSRVTATFLGNLIFSTWKCYEIWDAKFLLVVLCINSVFTFALHSILALDLFGGGGDIWTFQLLTSHKTTMARGIHQIEMNNRPKNNDLQSICSKSLEVSQANASESYGWVLKERFVVSKFNFLTYNNITIMIPLQILKTCKIDVLYHSMNWVKN